MILNLIKENSSEKSHHEIVCTNLKLDHAQMISMIFIIDLRVLLL